MVTTAWSCKKAKEKYLYFITKQWYWISAVSWDFIPFAVMIVGNISIVSRIAAANRQCESQMPAAGAKNEKTRRRN